MEIAKEGTCDEDCGRLINAPSKASMRFTALFLLALVVSSCANTPHVVLNDSKRVNVSIDGVEVAVSPAQNPNEYNAVEANPPLVRVSVSMVMIQDILGEPRIAELGTAWWQGYRGRLSPRRSSKGLSADASPIRNDRGD
jgi:hypothetical protein